jgi:hypothetical protein
VLPDSGSIEMSEVTILLRVFMDVNFFSDMKDRPQIEDVEKTVFVPPPSHAR